MPDDLTVAIERLRTSTQRLNQITDSAAQLVKDVETYLEESGVGSHASALMHLIGRPDEEPEGWVNLEYRRLSGKFRIAVVRMRYQGGPEYDEVEDVRAWSECNREEKLESFEKLPELLVALAAEVEKKSVEAEKVLATVAPKLSRFHKKGGK